MTTTLYAIHVRYSYYVGTLNAPESGCLRRDHISERDPQPLILLSSREEAERIIALLPEDRGHYVLRHGEYAAPAYRVLGVPARGRVALALRRAAEEAGVNEYALAEMQ